MSQSGAFLLLLLHCCIYLHPAIGLRDFWMDGPYNSSSDFNVRAKYGDNATLNCTNTDGEEQPDSSEILFWVLPDLRIMQINDSDRFLVLEGWAEWEVDDLGRMQIRIVQERHFGFYHCVLTPEYNGTARIVKKALNFKGPYFGDLWNFYRDSVIAGLICFFVFLGVGMAAIIFYEVKYHGASKNDDKDEIDDAKAEAGGNSASRRASNGSAISRRKSARQSEPEYVEMESNGGQNHIQTAL